MNRQLILHVGSPKCGSTYLQQVMLRNREMLAARGVAYVHDGGTHPGNGLAALDLTAARLEALFAGHPRAVLSHEDLFAAAGQAQALARMTAAQGIEVRVVAFLRPFSEFIYGDYSQFIKQHLERYLAAGQAFEGRGFERFAVDRSRALTSNGFLGQWRQLFSDPPPIVASHKTIRAVFETDLNITGLDWEVPSDRTNPSLRMEDCDRIVAAINRHAPADEVRAMLRQALRVAGRPDTGRTPERTAWIEALFYRQNQALLAGFGFDNRRAPDPGRDQTDGQDHVRNTRSGNSAGAQERRDDAGRPVAELPLPAAPGLAPDRV